MRSISLLEGSYRYKSVPVYIFSIFLYFCSSDSRSAECNIEEIFSLVHNFFTAFFGNWGGPIKYSNIPVRQNIFVKLNIFFKNDKKSLTSLEFKNFIFLYKEHSLCSFLEKHFLWPVFYRSQCTHFLWSEEFRERTRHWHILVRPTVYRIHIKNTRIR